MLLASLSVACGIICAKTLEKLECINQVHKLVWIVSDILFLRFFSDILLKGRRKGEKRAFSGA